MKNKTLLTQEDNLRRLAYRRGLKLVKFPKRSKRYKTDGPYALSDLNTQELIHKNLTIEKLEKGFKVRGWDFRRAREEQYHQELLNERQRIIEQNNYCLVAAVTHEHEQATLDDLRKWNREHPDMKIVEGEKGYE